MREQAMRGEGGEEGGERGRGCGIEWLTVAAAAAAEARRWNLREGSARSESGHRCACGRSGGAVNVGIGRDGGVVMAFPVGD